MAKRPLPPNLYERRGYYSWRNPETRIEFGIGRDKASAVAQAVEANIAIAKLTRQTRLIHRVNGSADRTVGAWCTKYSKLMERQKFADNTKRTYASLARRMERMLGPGRPLQSVTALEVSELLEQVADLEGKARTAQQLRNFMRDSFREAIVQGWRSDNPVIDTKLSTKVEVKRARLSLEVFMAVYEREQTVWAKNAYALALVSAQRREDISAAKFTDFREGAWWCVQLSEKSTHAHRIVIPLELKLEAFGMTVGEVVSQCRRTGVLARFLIHQTRPHGNSPIGSQIWVDTISRHFSDTLAELALDWADRSPPTFHEIRSLSERLYKAQGGVNTQHLLGHNDASTTAIYDDVRGSEWVRVLDERTR